jgi:hypothetical protein
VCIGVSEERISEKEKEMAVIYERTPENNYE